MSDHKAMRLMLGGYWVKRRGCEWRQVGPLAYRNAVRSPDVHSLESHEDWTTDDARRVREAAYVLLFAAFVMSCLLITVMV